MPSNVRPEALVAGQLTTGQRIYWGFTVRNLHATDRASVTIYDGTDDNGTVLEEIELIAKESAREFYKPDGINVEDGIFVAITGTVRGSVRVG